MDPGSRKRAAQWDPLGLSDEIPTDKMFLITPTSTVAPIMDIPQSAVKRPRVNFTETSLPLSTVAGEIYHSPCGDMAAAMPSSDASGNIQALWPKSHGTQSCPPDGFPIAGPSTEGDSWRPVNPDVPSQTYSYNHHVVETYKNMLKEQEARLWHRFGRLVNQLLDEEQEPLVQLNLMKIKEELREAATTALQPGAERHA
ncbi:hypothetical protein MRX96_050566 [Rhipicephalus microplus]